MAKKLLLLGSTGKMGLALRKTFEPEFEIIGKNSKDFNALDLESVREVINAAKPDILINTVAFLGIDPCEKEPDRAFKINTLYPKYLAELSNKLGYLFVHFSTDAVFNDEKKNFYIEKDQACPLNIYGLTKYGGDCFIQSIAKKYYIFRIPLLFGETTKNNQFVEKMLEKIKQGCKVLKVSGDIISSPSYSLDVAREVKRIIEAKYPFSIYHIANEGAVTLYELMCEIKDNLGLKVTIEKASYLDFPFIGIKNTCTPIKSGKLDKLRPWKEAVREYCENIKNNF